MSGTPLIGLGTYAFFWQHSELAPERLDLTAMLERSHALGVGLFQICDYAPLEQLDVAALADLAAQARDLDITLELGTRGIGTQHLDRYLAMATAVGATTVRSMVNTATEKPTLSEAEAALSEALPAWKGAGVALALETYEQISSTDLVSIVESVGSPSLGICLDPANSVAALENPRDVIDRTASYVKNIHVKDFQFTRRGGWVGFTLEGAPLGTGLLDFDYLIDTVRPAERGINLIVEHWLPLHDTLEETVRPAERGITQIIEHWLPLGDSIEETIETENTWNTSTLQYLRSK